MGVHCDVWKGPDGGGDGWRVADDLKFFDPRGTCCHQRRGRSWFRFVDGRINPVDAIALNGAKELVVPIVDVDVGGVRCRGHGHGAAICCSVESDCWVARWRAH